MGRRCSRIFSDIVGQWCYSVVTETDDVARLSGGWILSVMHTVISISDISVANGNHRVTLYIYIHSLTHIRNIQQHVMPPSRSKTIYSNMYTNPCHTRTNKIHPIHWYTIRVTRVFVWQPNRTDDNSMLAYAMSSFVPPRLLLTFAATKTDYRDHKNYENIIF